MKKTKESNNETDQCKYHHWKQRPKTRRGYKMDAECKSCGEKRENIFPATTFEGFIRRWVHAKLTGKNSKGKVIAQRNIRNYHGNSDRLYYKGAGRNVSHGEDTLAIKLPDGRIIGNASRLKRCGSYRRGSEAPAQQVMMQLAIPLIPFNVFEEAGLDLFKAEIVEQGPAEKLTLPKLIWSQSAGMLVPMRIWERKYQQKKPVKIVDIKNAKEDYWYKWKTDRNIKITGWSFDKLIRKNLEQRHFIGAMLLRVEDKYYLFDADRNELQYYRFNAFISELPKPCKTIKEAYEMLIPPEIKHAMKKGKKVVRQGEWFFIKTKMPKKVAADKRSKKIADNRPNSSEYDLDGFYKDWGELRITKKAIEDGLKKIRKPYQDDALKRIKSYHRAVDRYEKALKVVHREDPDKYAKRGELRAGNNRPNNVSKFVSLPEGEFVKGKITHSGREHEPIVLNSWCRAMPNTAVNSFTIQGQID